MKGSTFAGITLVLMGTILLLRELSFYYPSKGFIIGSISFIIGLAFLNNMRRSPQRKGLLGGMFFIFLSFEFFLMEFRVLPIDDILTMGLVFINLGLANILYGLFSSGKISNLVLGLINLAIGLPFVIDYYNLLPGWLLVDIIATYWPVLIVIIGLGILIDGFRKRKNISENSIA